MTMTDLQILQRGYNSEAKSVALVEHRIPDKESSYGSFIGKLYTYLWFRNGIYISAERPEMRVVFSLVEFETRGLELEGDSYFEFKLPRVPLSVMNEIFERANFFANDNLETLFHLTWSDLNPFDGGWLVNEPEQDRSWGDCTPTESGGSHDRAIIEIHSHHSMPARFSEKDDTDETGFRLYGLIGGLPERPEFRLRVGVYGYFWEIPAEWVLELPDGVQDHTRRLFYGD